MCTNVPWYIHDTQAAALGFKIDWMIFGHVAALLKRATKSKEADFVPPDPAIEFPHAENSSLFARLREDSKIGIPGVIGGYELRSHSDLTSILDSLINDPGVKKGYAYGRSVLSNSNGLVFGYVGGTRIFLKLRPDRIDAARRDGGWFDRTYGEDWVEFRVGGRSGVPTDWEKAMRRWAAISYQDSLGIG